MRHTRLAAVVGMTAVVAVAPAGVAAIQVMGPLPPGYSAQPIREAVPSPHRNFSNNIMLTGYWPPTGDMIRQFSTNTDQNPAGWNGGNWEDRGYNVYSFFPEFPGGTGVSSRGVGDFEIDYQDTSADWARIVEQVRPIAIITFSWTGGRTEYGRLDWELESRNKNRTTWTNDYLAPLQPTLRPPDPTFTPNGTRYSSLPMDEIRDAVNGAAVGVNSYIDDFSTTYGGSFLSEYIGYHGVWYHDMHSTPYSDDWNIAAGHIHVGQNVSVAAGALATEVTLRTLTGYLDSVIAGNGFLTERDGLVGDGNEVISPPAAIPAPGSAVVLAVAALGLRRRGR